MAAKNLVVVESPAKAKTLARYLGRDYEVKASVGHLVDLPKNKLGVNVDGDFEPDYEVIRGKGKVIKELKSAASGKDRIYLAPDPDREGEAIAYHIAQHVVPKSFRGKVHRVLFNEITKSAVQSAIKNPVEIDEHKFEAQQARRVIDRLVGYQISPLLWDKVRRGLSAGRVQSVAVRLIVEREREIQGFQAIEYWQITAKVAPGKTGNGQFEARLVEVDGRKIDLKSVRAADGSGDGAASKAFYIADEKQARELEARFRAATEWKVLDVKKSERQRRAAPPFITSTLQQEASRKHGFQPRRTMSAAQRLYEGIELGDAGITGLITYMRTDSTRVSAEAQAAALSYIRSTFGDAYAPETPNTFRQKKGAQDAHEAIRPTSLEFPPDRVRQYLPPDELRVYTLIWNRFLASQMSAARYDQTSVDIEAAGGRFRASGQVIKFDGFLRVYEEGRDTPEESEEAEGLLPELRQGQLLDLRELLTTQHYTQPPPRFTQASLIRELEEQGIGRPSTYATIMSTILGREYVKQDDNKRLLPTELGILVTDLLVEAFPDILNVEFTAGLEDELDEVEAGKKGWLDTTKHFYTPFRADLERARVEMRDVKREVTETELPCPNCGKRLVVKWGRNGEFVACPAYPECKFTANFTRKEDGSIELEEPETTEEVCEKCGAPMRYKFSKFGRFLGCSAYPECKNVKSANQPIPIGVACPAVLGGCGEGEMVQKTSRRGKIFFSCNRYPKCKFALWDKPVPVPCPECEAPVVVEKTTKRAGTVRRCAREGCGYMESLDEGMSLQE
ncbi:MAG TPA: type I DNA topoisomerase [Candidatus Limnocylindrales bacterium]|nr:type I DNA topoisomerase [Candidatus Limnocylindrales bacterium]